MFASPRKAKAGSPGSSMVIEKTTTVTRKTTGTKYRSRRNR
jgi:hypothetical protein